VDLPPYRLDAISRDSDNELCLVERAISWLYTLTDYASALRK
jgi:hypothetical protein